MHQYLARHLFVSWVLDKALVLQFFILVERLYSLCQKREREREREREKKKRKKKRLKPVPSTSVSYFLFCKNGGYFFYHKSFTNHFTSPHQFKKKLFIGKAIFSSSVLKNGYTPLPIFLLVSNTCWFRSGWSFYINIITLITLPYKEKKKKKWNLTG